jgi:hypothetical protein
MLADPSCLSLPLYSVVHSMFMALVMAHMRSRIKWTIGRIMDTTGYDLRGGDGGGTNHYGTGGGSRLVAFQFPRPILILTWLLFLIGAAQEDP